MDEYIATEPKNDKSIFFMHSKYISFVLEKSMLFFIVTVISFRNKFAKQII